jgi:hypothetical protein
MLLPTVGRIPDSRASLESGGSLGSAVVAVNPSRHHNVSYLKIVVEGSGDACEQQYLWPELLVHSFRHGGSAHVALT